MTDPRRAPEASLMITRWYPASSQAVYLAWTQPDMLKRWFSPGDDIATPLVEIDLRVGGRYRIGFGTPGEEMNVVGGEYREVRPGRKLIYTWMWEKPNEFAGHDTLVTVEFKEVDGGTELVLTHERIPDDAMREKHAWGWNGSLDRLARVLPGAR